MSEAKDQAPAIGSPVIQWLLGVSIRRPRRVLGVWGVLLLLAAPGVLRLEFETTASSLLNRSGPAWERYQESLELFGGDEVIVAAIPADSPFDPAVIAEVQRVTEALEGLDGVRRVDSVSSVPMVQASPDGALRLDPAIEGEPPRSPVAVAEARALLLGDRIAPRTILNEAGTVFAVNVLVDSNVGERQEALVEAVHATLGDAGGWISGVPIFETRVGLRTLREIALFVPITLAFLVGFLALIFRAWLAVAVPLAVSTAGSWMTVGLMGAVGEPMTMIAMLLPSVLLALGCAYVMHLLTAVRGVPDAAVRIRSMERVAAPIALSGLTTSIGFFAMSTVDIDAIRALGAYGGTGVLVTLAATLTLAPAILQSASTERWSRTLDDRVGGFGRGVLMRFVAARRGTIVVAWIALLSLTGWGLARLEVETDGAHWWPRGSPVRDAFEAIRERLAGISPMNVVIRSLDGRPVIDPDVLERIDALAAYLNELPGVGKAISVGDPLRQVHGGFAGEVSLPLPGDRALAAQYLLLLESVDHIHDLVSRDRLAANVVIRADNNGSRDLLEVAGKADAWWDASGAPGFAAKTTGIMFEFARAEDEITWGQIRGLSLALGAISLVLLAIFRRPVIAGMALVPNLVPLVVIFGTMGLLRVPLDAGTVCLGCLALGIAVDDTIHVVAGYREEREGGAPRGGALATTFARVLPALAYTTAAIAIGFAVLGLSEFTLTRNLGLVTASVVVLCLAADVTLLPALLMLRERRSGGR